MTAVSFDFICKHRRLLLASFLLLLQYLISILRLKSSINWIILPRFNFLEFRVEVVVLRAFSSNNVSNLCNFPTARILVRLWSFLVQLILKHLWLISYLFTFGLIRIASSLVQFILRRLYLISYLIPRLIRIEPILFHLS